MKLHKRIISAFASLAIFAGTMVFAAPADKIYVSEDFNGYAENETKTSASCSGIAYVKSTSETNKALEVTSGISRTNVKTSWDEKSDKTVLSFTATHKKIRSTVELAAAGRSQADQKLLEMKSDGGIYTYDGKEIGGFSLDEKRTISVVINSIDDVYDIYINGKCVLSDWNLPATIYPQSMVVTVSAEAGEEGSVLLDNLRAYSGDHVNKKFYETKYNPEIVEIVDIADRVGANIFAKSDFELAEGDAPKSMSGFVLNMKENVAEIKTEEDNHYLRLEQVNSSDFHIDSNFTSDVNYLAMQYDIRFEQFGSTIYPFNVRDNVSGTSSADEMFGTIDSTGSFRLSNGTTAYKFKTGTWYNLAIVMNFPQRTINVYVDHELVAEKLPMRNSNFLKPRMVRFWILGAGPLAVNLDNYYIYEAKEPVNTLDDLEKKEVFVLSDGTREKTFLENRTAMCISNGLVYSDGKKQYMSVPEEKDDDYYTDRKTAEALLGELDESYTDNIPLKAAAKEKNIYVYENKDNYLLVFSQNKFDADEKFMAEVSTFMKMLLPSADEVKADFTALAKPHPRIMVDADGWEQIKKNIETYPEFASWHKKIMAQADSKMTTPVEYYHFGEVQQNILQTTRRFKEKMLYWGYAYRITGDKKYVERAYKEMEAVSKFPDWSPVHPIDTGELLFGSAVGYDWMYDALTPDERKTIEEGTYNLGIKVLRSAYYGRLHTAQTFGSLSGGAFVSNTTNFNVVANGGLTAAALAYADVYPDECFDAISKAIESVGVMLPGFEPSGGWSEGPNYWNYTTSYLSYMVSVLYSACGTDYGIFKHPGVALTPYYAIYLDSFQGLNNFSDTSGGWSWDSPQFSCFGKYMNEPAFTYQRYFTITQRNAKPSIFDMIWLDMSQKDAKPSLPLDNLTPGIDMVSMREDWDRSDSLNFGTHGGDNTAYHGHYDGGTWIFDILGERWALDLGMDDKSYVGYTMDQLYRTRAEGHNMIVFNPSTDVDFDRNSTTKVLRFESKDKGGIVVYDNSEAYRRWATDVKRGFYVGDERRSLTVRDEFTVSAKDTVTYWSMHTKADIEVDGNKAILTMNGKKLQVEFASDCDNFEVLALKADPLPGSVQNDIMAKDPDVNKLAVRLTTSGSTYIEAKLSAVGEPAAESGMINKPISEWTIPDGALIRRGDSTLSNIFVNGVAKYDFAPNTTTYTIGVLEGEEVPQITAESTNGEFEIKQAKSLDEETTIISHDSSNYYSTTYVIKYMLLKKPADVFDMTRNIVYDLQVSSTPEEANIGPNMLDGDLSTRWAGLGVGETALFDLGSVKPIDAFCAAYEWGDQRKYSFAIEVSEDGIYYKEILKTASCGTTDGYELFKLPERVNARYVRYVGNGNTVNTWNGVREFGILTNKEAN